MNTKTTKKALITSIISMLVCFTMLIGTTFAWFTDSVTNDNNVIKTGTLDVGFYWSNAYDNVKNTAIDRTNANWNDAGTSGAIFNNTLWEPGYAEARHIKITNEGTLALRYSLAIIPHGEVSELADVIDVYVVDDATTTIGNRDNIDQKYYRGNLRTFIANGGTEVKKDDGTAGNKETTATKNPTITSGKLAADGEYTATIVLKMREEAGNEYKDLSIGSNFSIQLMATQVTAEKDSFDDQYDVNAYYVVNNTAELRQAIANAVDTTTIFLQAGDYEIDYVIDISDKELTLVGLGVVNFKQVGGTHIMNVANGSNMTLKNINMDGGKTATNPGYKNGIYVRNNSTVTLDNCTVKNTKSFDIMIDEGSDAEHGKTTTSTVNLVSSTVEDVAMCASPVTSVPKATQDTFAEFNFDANSTVGYIERQAINVKPENCSVNGDKTADNGFVFYVNNDAQLTDALAMIHGESKFWNVPVTVKLGAGNYYGNYTINQYPEWNGVEGAGGSGNNYAAGVPANAPALKLTFVGTTAVAGRAVATKPAAVFVGKVTVNGFGNAGTGFATSNANPAPITFNNVAFDGEKLLADEKGNKISVALLKAADNVYFNNCYFTNTTHVTLGARSFDQIDNVAFDGCNFVNAGCLSGYPKNVALTNCVATGSNEGFLNIQNQANVTVDNCTVDCKTYFLRTNGSGINVTVTDTAITLYRAGDAGEETDYLVYFRGSNESVTFTDCTLPANYTTMGVDADSTLKTYYDVNDVTYVKDELTGKVSLYLVNEEYTADTLVVPEGIDAIGNYAFKYNNNVKTVILASTVRDLGRGFDESNVEKVVLNEGLEVISSRAFKSTLNLKEVVISSTVTEIADNAFQKSGIKNIVIPANVKTIGEAAFGASLIETVTFEGNIEIQGYAFRGCTKLSTVNFNGDNVDFVKSTLNGRNSCWICNGESNNPGVSTITFNVNNPVVKAKVLAAMGADVTTITINCELVADETTGMWVDENGNDCAYATNDATLADVINGGADVIYLGDGNYILPFAAQGKTLAIIGSSNTNIATASNGSYEGCNYALDGSTVVFENITINTTSTIYVGYARCKATFNNCTINGTYTLYDNTTFNNCTFNVSGDSYNIWTWGAPNATFNNCIFNTSGKAILFYGNVNSILTVNNCVFNDDNKFADVNNKAAIEVGSDWAADTKTIIATNCTVNGFDVTNKGICTGTTLFGNKNSLTGNRLSVTVDGMTYVCVSNAEELTAAINAANDGDEIIVGDGTYNLRFTNDTNFNVDNLTITGVGNVTVNVTSSEAWYGRIQGNNVTFDGITFTSAVGTTGKATYNNCKFESWAICAVSGETYYNNCEIAVLNTSSDFNSGNVYVKDSVVTGAEYSFRSPDSVMSFENCEIGELIIWSNKTVLTDCTIDLNDVTIHDGATLVVDGNTYVSDGLLV